jgi:hypothetical protein
MKENRPDPIEARITAYALGELSAEESAQFEREIAGDPASRAEVGSIQAIAALLREGFGRELDAMFHPKGLSEPAPIFSVVEFADAEEEEKPAAAKVVFMPKVAVVALAAALVAAVAVAPMLREQSGSAMGLADNGELPMAVMEIDGDPLSSEPLEKVVWKEPAAIRESLALTVPGADGMGVGLTREDSPIGFHLTGSAGGSKPHHLSYIDPDFSRMKSSIEAARRRIEMAESLLRMAETSSEAAVILKGFVDGNGLAELESNSVDSVYGSLLMEEECKESDYKNASETKGTVFRYGSRDEHPSGGNGFELGPVWWPSAKPGSGDGAE